MIWLVVIFLAGLPYFLYQTKFSSVLFCLTLFIPLPLWNVDPSLLEGLFPACIAWFCLGLHVAFSGGQRGVQWVAWMCILVEVLFSWEIALALAAIAYATRASAQYRMSLENMHTQDLERRSNLLEEKSRLAYQHEEHIQTSMAILNMMTLTLDAYAHGDDSEECFDNILLDMVVLANAESGFIARWSEHTNRFVSLAVTDDVRKVWGPETVFERELIVHSDSKIWQIRATGKEMLCGRDEILPFGFKSYSYVRFLPVPFCGAILGVVCLCSETSDLDAELLKPIVALIGILMDGFGAHQRTVEPKRQKIKREKPNILVYEKNRVSEIVMRRMLTDFGCQTVLVNSSEDCIRECASTAFHAVLLCAPTCLSDDGWRLVEELRGLDGWEKTPIIGCASFFSDSTVDVSKERGMTSILGKPVLFRSLRDVLLEFGVDIDEGE